MKLFKSRNSILLICCAISFTLGGFISRNEEPEKITIALIQQAQKLFGLEFSPSESDSMVTELESQRKNFNAIRMLNIPNEVSPALSFDPRPVGYQFPDKRNFFQIQPIPLHEFDWEDVPYMSIPELAFFIKNQRISAVQLCEFFIARIEKYNPTLEFVITTTRARALKQAALADKEISSGNYRGVLHGIPFGAKDLLSTKNYKTTWGSVAYQNQLIDGDASVISKLEANGAILIAKTTLGELAMGDVWFGGKTKNPWDIRRGSSGSSAGSASAVAAGCMPFAIGSETLGSIVSPSAECGTTGLRPTFGRVSKTGAMALSWSMDKLGPIARSAEDCAIVFNAIHGTDGIDAGVIDAPFEYSLSGKEDLRGFRIGYIPSEFNRKYPNKINDSLSLKRLKLLGAELVPIELPNFPYGDMLIILSAESGAAFQELSLSNRDDLLVRQNKNAWPNSFRASQFIPAVEYIQANRARTQLIAEFDSIMQGIDAFVAPATGRNLLATNLTGHPAVALQNGFRNNLPTSITFTGKLFGEGKLLAIAEIYQKEVGFRERHPKLDFQK